MESLYTAAYYGRALACLSSFGAKPSRWIIRKTTGSFPAVDHHRILRYTSPVASVTAAVTD